MKSIVLVLMVMISALPLALAEDATTKQTPVVKIDCAEGYWPDTAGTSCIRTPPTNTEIDGTDNTGSNPIVLIGCVEGYQPDTTGTSCVPIPSTVSTCPVNCVCNGDTVSCPVNNTVTTPITQITPVTEQTPVDTQIVQPTMNTKAMITPTTESETVIMKCRSLAEPNCGNGAEIRLLQLEKEIRKNLQVGTEVVLKVKEKGYNFTEMDNILIQMKLLIEKVQSVDPNSDKAVEEFVALKEAAIDLSQKFKTEAMKYITLSDDEKEDIKEKANNDEYVKELDIAISEKKIEYNAEKFQEIYSKIGINATETINKYKEGDISLKEVSKELMTKFKEMNKEEIKQAYIEIKQEQAKKVVEAKQTIEESKIYYLEAKKAVLVEVLQEVQNMNESKKKEVMDTKIENKIEKIDTAIVKINDKIEKQDDKIEKIDEKSENKSDSSPTVGGTE